MTKSRRDDTQAMANNPALPASVDELEAYIPYLLNRLVSHWNFDQNRRLAAHSINSTMFRTLSALHINGTLTVNEIASFAFVEQSNASRAIEQMVSAGLVLRRVSDLDSRRREIALSQKGRDLLQELWPVMADNYRRLVGDLPDEELKRVVATLSAMIRNLDAPVS